MRYPRFLKEGGKIGFVAPAFGCATEPYITGFNKANDVFSGLGYKTAEGPNCHEAKGLGISNTPELCAKELEDMYCSPDNDVLMSCGGGELMCSILSHLDSERIRKADPKWFMGFSDNTNFTFLQATICDTAAIYGPNAPAFGALVRPGIDDKPGVLRGSAPSFEKGPGRVVTESGERWQESVEDAFDLLSGKKMSFKGYPLWEKEGPEPEEGRYPLYNLTEKRVITANREEVHLSGRLVGGCLDCLVNLAGTSFDKMKEFASKYERDGVIFFFESCDLNPFGVYRALWQLKNAGWFEHTKGFLVGRPLHYGEEMFGLGMDRAVLEVLGDLNVPILMNLDFGHLPPRIPIITGAYSHIEYREQKFEMSYELK